MTSIVITYFNRELQLLKTLESFLQYDPDSFNVVIVDDESPNPLQLPEYPFKVIVKRLENKTWSNTCSVHNEGIHEALKSNPDIIIIQNAECYHFGNILSYAQTVTDENYITFGCYSLGKEESFEVRNDRIAAFDGDSAWYNHSVHRPLALHFCSAITTKNLIKLNGFDERLSQGIAYEDNMFVHQIRNLGLRIDIIDFPMVFHQYHYDGLNRDPDLINKNAKLFEELSKGTDYRAIHKLTPDL